MEKHEKRVKLASLWAQIWTHDLPNAKFNHSTTKFGQYFYKCKVYRVINKQ
jgi:hypothetical protein